MVHYTHLTKIKAHHRPPQAYMQNLNLNNFFFLNDDHEEKERVNISWKYQQQQQQPKKIKNKNKTLQEQGRKTITTFYASSVKLSDEREKRRSIKKYSRWLSECLKCFPFECF